MTGPSVRVVLADDHPPTRMGVRLALAGDGFEVEEAADAATAVELVRRLRPDVCLLDITMPGGGIDAARQIAQHAPETAVVMLTVSSDDQNLFDALQAGAVGYLLKTTDPERLPHALRGVLRGEAALPRTLAARVLKAFAASPRSRVVARRNGGETRLTPREWEVLQLLREGRSTAEIAAQLAISSITVRRHISSTLAKLGARNRSEAAREPR
jgi:DNA-binding NarL/FixJ family response regulator